MTSIRQLLKSLWSSQRFALRLTRVLLMLFVGVVLYVMLFESSFIYFPTKYPQGSWEVTTLNGAKNQAAPRIEDVWFTATDGIKLHGWYCTPQRAVQGTFAHIEADMVVLFLHGNGGNITHRYELIKGLMNVPAEVFIIDYRGYGRSNGNPSEQGLYNDARGAWNYLVTERKVREDRIVIFGESLGGAVAIQIASQVKPAGLIVQSSFTSIADMARRVMPYAPRFLLRTKMNSLETIRSVQNPKLFIHSPADEVVPFEMGRRLFDAAPEPKHFYTVEGASHNEIDIVGGEAYFDRIRSFVQTCAEF